MSHKEIVDYSRQYFASERSACAEDVMTARSGGEPLTSQKDLIADFYGEMEMYHEQDRRAFDVRAVAEDHNVGIVSAIRSYGNLGPFRPVDRREFKGVRLFDIVLRPGQIACCSTVARGDTANNLYHNWGVIIGKGTVQQAFAYDATTSVSQGKVQSQLLPRVEHMRPVEQMLQAIYSRLTYNEINVKVGGLSGLFYCIDSDKQSSRDMPSETFINMLEPLGMPQYLLQDGSFYKMRDRSDLYKGTTDAPTPVTDIVQQVITPTNEQAAGMIGHLTKMLTLAPRNSITSGFARGTFVFEHRNILPKNAAESFLHEQARLLEQDNPSLRLYGAMALLAYAEAAEAAGDPSDASVRASAMGSQHLDRRTYTTYRERILPSGNLAITEQDFRHYLEHESLPEYLQDH